MRGGKMARNKGARIERELVDAHKKIGVHAERYPLSGATHFRGTGHDVDIYPYGAEEVPMVAEIKARKDGGGFAMLEKWLGEYDVLFLRRDRQDPLVVLPWRAWAHLLQALSGKPVRWTDGSEKQVPDEGPEAGVSP